MPRVTEQTKQITVSEYLEFEQTATTRHEFVNGQIFAMAGGSKTHNRIALNLAFRALTAAHALDCEVFSSDVKVQTDDVYYYPNVIISCEKKEGKYEAST